MAENNQTVKKDKEYFYQTQHISFPDQQPAGTLYKDIVLNNAYQRCVGIALFPITDGGQSFFRVGLGDQNQDYLNNIHYKALVSSEASGLEVDKRFMKVNIKAEGHILKLRTEIQNQVTSELSYDFILLLERDKKM
ncbi:hypothetical protein [Flammeovirga sp. EKP202]|uniref:hypothetical protein n=1 Tax=Flammeovirga sp. EKP202 TaxID=2770592 RepID=UPI00165F48A3|nr:hypothetical protein [Flammeovirga sp. EKP202]MBD0403209.1 hypothetical protein [Flammeovirga sp. EKP202]